MRKTWFVAALVAAVTAGPAAAQVQSPFAKVVDTAAGTMFTQLNPWAGINNSGLVAFQAMEGTGRDRFFTARPGQTPVIIADNNQSGRIYDAAFVAVSDRGDVPYWRQFGGTPASIHQHIGPAGPSVTIASSPTFNLDPGAFGNQSANPNINSANQVVFYGRTTAGGQGVHVATFNGSSVSYTTIAQSPTIVQPIGGPDLNAGGTAVFKAVYFPAGGGQATGLFIGGGGVPVTQIANTAGPISDFGGWPVLNDAGAVLYLAQFDDGHRGIFRYENGTSTPVLEVGSELFLNNPSMNNRGEIAFTTFSTGGPSRLLTGPNPATDTVIETGDPLDGSTVVSLSISQNALNDFGQIVFAADLADGRRGIYVYTPVPEPGAVLAVAGVGLIAVARRRRR